MKNVNVNELRKHIHAELFEKSIFPTSRDNLKSIGEIKEHLREETIMRSIRIMRSHDQTDTDIREMLKNKFFLNEEEINRILEKEKEIIY